MSRLYTRKMRHKHIKRKKRICESVYGFDWYRNGDGYYDKGKIHCSCPMCAVKSNDRKLVKSRGPVSMLTHSTRIPSTHNRYGRKNWKPSDRRRVDSMLFHMENDYDT